MRKPTDEDRQKARYVGMDVKAYMARMAVLERQISLIYGKEKDRIGKSK